MNVEMQPYPNGENPALANLDLQMSKRVIAYPGVIPEVYGSDVSSKGSPRKMSSSQTNKHDFRLENSRYKQITRQRLIDFENLRLYR